MKVYETLAVKKDHMNRYMISVATPQLEFFYMVRNKVNKMTGRIKLQRSFGFQKYYSGGTQYANQQEILCLPSGKVKNFENQFDNHLIYILGSLNILEILYSDLDITT